MKAFIGCKVIKAARITAINRDRDDNRAQLVLERGEKINVSEDYMNKRQPRVGGYYVVYPDGYKSWSPGETFDNAYREIKEDEARIVLDAHWPDESES